MQTQQDKDFEHDVALARGVIGEQVKKLVGKCEQQNTNQIPDTKKRGAACKMAVTNKVPKGAPKGTAEVKMVDEMGLVNAKKDIYNACVSTLKSRKNWAELVKDKNNIPKACAQAIEDSAK